MGHCQVGKGTKIPEGIGMEGADDSQPTVLLLILCYEKSLIVKNLGFNPSSTPSNKE